MSRKTTVYAIEITEEGFENFGDDSTSAEEMAEQLKINSIMTDFSWDESENRNLILTARIKDDVKVGEALEELASNEYISSVYEY